MEALMAFHVRDPDTDRVVRELASLKGLTLTETIRDAATKELDALNAAEALRDDRPLRERIKDIQDRIAARGWTGLKADKAFFDSLSDEE
jgi:antitoxin VapB